MSNDIYGCVSFMCQYFRMDFILGKKHISGCKLSSTDSGGFNSGCNCHCPWYLLLTQDANLPMGNIAECPKINWLWNAKHFHPIVQTMSLSHYTVLNALYNTTLWLGWYAKLRFWRLTPDKHTPEPWPCVRPWLTECLIVVCNQSLYQHMIFPAICLSVFRICM